MSDYEILDGRDTQRIYEQLYGKEVYHTGIIKRELYNRTVIRMGDALEEPPLSTRERLLHSRVLLWPAEALYLLIFPGPDMGWASVKEFFKDEFRDLDHHKLYDLRYEDITSLSCFTSLGTVATLALEGPTTISRSEFIDRTMDQYMGNDKIRAFHNKYAKRDISTKHQVAAMQVATEELDSTIRNNLPFRILGAYGYRLCIDETDSGNISPIWTINLEDTFTPMAEEIERQHGQKAKEQWFDWKGRDHYSVIVAE